MATNPGKPATPPAKTSVRPVVVGKKDAAPVATTSLAKPPAKPADDLPVRKPVSGTPQNAMHRMVPTSELMESMPDFIQQDTEIVGTEDMARYVVLPRLKIVQKMTGEHIRENFPVGAVIRMPLQELVAGIGVNPTNGLSDSASEIFHVIPIMFYREWNTWRKYSEQQEGEAPVIYSTTDEHDPVAIKATDPNRRDEVLEDGRTVHHCEHLNFIVRIHEPGHPVDGQIAVMSFLRGQHRDGRDFARMIKMRRKSIYACVFAVKTTKRENQEGDWYAFEFDQPEGRSAWVETPELYAELQQLHAGFSDSVKQQRVKVSYDDEAEVVAEPVDGEDQGV